MRKKISATLFLISISALFYLSVITTNKEDDIISSDPNYTVAKIYKIKSGRSFTYAHYFFYYNGNEYRSGQYIDSDDRDKLNKYFEIELSSENPKYSRVNLEKEILDVKVITRAGF